MMKNVTSKCILHSVQISRINRRYSHETFLVLIIDDIAFDRMTNLSCHIKTNGN